MAVAALGVAKAIAGGAAAAADAGAGNRCADSRYDDGRVGVNGLGVNAPLASSAASDGDGDGLELSPGAGVARPPCALAAAAGGTGSICAAFDVNMAIGAGGDGRDSDDNEAVETEGSTALNADPGRGLVALPPGPTGSPITGVAAAACIGGGVAGSGDGAAAATAGVTGDAPKANFNRVAVLLWADFAPDAANPMPLNAAVALADARPSPALLAAPTGVVAAAGGSGVRAASETVAGDASIDGVRKPVCKGGVATFAGDRVAINIT